MRYECLRDRNGLIWVINAFLKKDQLTAGAFVAFPGGVVDRIAELHSMEGEVIHIRVPDDYISRTDRIAVYNTRFLVTNV